MTHRKEIIKIMNWKKLDITMCDLMTLSEFEEELESESITDYDGEGYYVKKEDGIYYESSREVFDIDISELVSKFIREENITHVAWYNK